MKIFKDNPSLDVAYKTTDGKFFFLENDAKNYASTLEDKKVTKVERTEGIQSSDDEIPNIPNDIKEESIEPEQVTPKSKAKK